MKNVLEKIKTIRSDKGYSHEYMGHMLGMSQTAYTKIEKGTTKLSLEKLYKIAEILEAPIVDILDINPNNIYNQTNNHDNTTLIAHQEIQNLYEENKGQVEKIELLYEARLRDKDFIIETLKKIVEAK